MFTVLDGRVGVRAAHPARRTTLGGAGWEYFTAGEGPRGVLLLGGALSFGDTCHRLIQRLEISHRVVSPSYPRVDSAAQLVDGLVSLLDVEGLEQVDVFGYGLGAGLAHLLVRRHGDRVGKLALAGFGLATPLRAAATRALTEMFELAPTGAVHLHFERLFRRHAALSEDPARAQELLSISRKLLERHSRDSALLHARLLGDLCRSEGQNRLDEPVPTRAMLLQANDDPVVTRSEQSNLERAYPRATVVRYRNAGRLIGLTPAPELERKLELFFAGQRSPLPVCAGAVA